MKKLLPFSLLFLTIILGFSMRVIGIEWDHGHHMHPDERAIIMSASELHFPSSIEEFLSKDSPWNPKFFAYGSFPFYLLRITGDVASYIDPLFGEYAKINIVGRLLSAIFDTGTILLLYSIGKHLKNRRIGFLSAFLYAISVLPIQLSHFYAVDTILTFFLMLTLLLLLKFYEKPRIVTAISIGISIGLSLATKISATVILSSVFLALCLDFLLIFLKRPHKISQWGHHLPPFMLRLVGFGGTIILVSLFVFVLSQPYALIDFERFSKQLIEQSHMTKDAFTFPYTLQYVGKIPYVYEIKNIFLFGMGPLMTLLALSGLAYCLYRVIFRSEQFPWQKMLIILQFAFIYFLITGSFAIGFMRYMLPLYPIFALCAAMLLGRIFDTFSLRSRIALFAISVFLLIWPLSFMSVYFRPNTKVIASEWIHKNIPAGSTIATEHWDDTLPLAEQFKYTMESLPMYESDTPEKWTIVNSILERSDYIILASNRLYVPLMRLTDCINLPSHRCYLRTSLYYKELFEGTMGFKKVAEFTSHPTIPFTHISINDQRADESFTVYDHPKIMIFKKITD